MLPKYAARKRIFLALSSIIFALAATLPLIKALAQIPTNSVSAVAWSPDGSKLAIGSSNGTVYIQDAATGKFIRNWHAHTDKVSALAWKPDGSQLVTASLDRRLRIWDIATGKMLTDFPSNIEQVLALGWSPDSKRILSISVEAEMGKLKIWDTLGTLLESRAAGTSVWLAWSPDGSKLAVSVALGVVRIFDGTTLAYLYDLVAPESSGKAYDPVYNIYRIAWNPDGTQIASGSLNGLVRIWDISKRQIIADLRVDNQSVGWDTSGIEDLTFNADGTRLFSMTADGIFHEWNVVTKQLLGSMQIKTSSPIHAVAWSAYGSRVAIGNVAISSNNAIRVIVPFPSTDELQALTKRCTKPDVQQSLTAKLDTKQLPAIISAVKTLTSDQIPPACAADLVAVAEALQAKP
ncbi:MAG: WD40 repeat domain-containing protein [Chloroflexota bacterium]